MAGLEVAARQRSTALLLLEEALAVADWGGSFKAMSYRAWLTEPSESLRVILGQAGYTPEAWRRRIAARAGRWLAEAERVA